MTPPPPPLLHRTFASPPQSLKCSSFSSFQIFKPTKVSVLEGIANQDMGILLKIFAGMSQ